MMGISWEFLLVSTALVVGSCPSAMGRLSAFCVLLYFRQNTRLTVKNKPSLPPLLFFATHILKINNDLLSSVLAAWALSSLPCFHYKNGTGYFNYLLVGLFHRIPLVM